MPRLVSRRLLMAALVVLLAFVALDAAPAFGCPSCGKAVAQQDNGQSLQTGYQASILLLMSAPFVILGGLTALFSWEIHKAKLRAAAQAGPGSLGESLGGPTAAPAGPNS